MYENEHMSMKTKKVEFLDVPLFLQKRVCKQKKRYETKKMYKNVQRCTRQRSMGSKNQYENKKCGMKTKKIQTEDTLNL